MAITADLNGKNYVLGKGQAFFDRFANGVDVTATTRGTGERYFGNTPEFSTSSSAENLDHFDADAGVKTKDAAVQLSIDRTGSFVCDNINSENVALFFQGTSSVVTTAGAVGTVETITVKKGMFYQLGVGESTPSGVRKITNLVVKSGSPGFATTVTQATNLQLDADLARVYILDDAADVTDDMILQFTYDVTANTREQVVSSNDAIYGALRFVSNNPRGANRDYYFPYVKLAPDGDYALKGDEWLQMGFTFDILLKASNIAAAYIDGRPA